MDFSNRKTVSLWSKKAPLSKGNKSEDIPTITPYLPCMWNKKPHAVIILPGGGYSMLADHEGESYAEYLSAQGITAFVLKYRLGSNGYHHPCMLSDAARGIRLIRQNAAKFDISPHKIGLMGSSAGGHLAAVTATFHELGLREADEPSGKNLGRPDFTILCYPVISGVASYRHFGSFKFLLGDNPEPDDLELLSMEKSCGINTPPAFIWHTFEDDGVPVENSIYYALGLRKYKIPFELHVYEKGGHGKGLFDGHPWGEECIRWISLF